MGELRSAVAAVRAHALRIPFERSVSSALARYDWLDMTVVEVVTEDGVTGLGYNYGVGGHASCALVPYITQELAPLVIGEDVTRPAALWERLAAPNKARVLAGLGAWALSAVDIAVWDAFARTQGMPLHRILGSHADTVPVYGSGGWLTLSDEELVDECAGFIERGIGAYKYKIGGPRDDARTHLLRKEFGADLELLVDANQVYSVAEAIEVSRMLAHHGVAWMEEPVIAASVDDLAEVARHSAVPLAAGENLYTRWEFRELCTQRSVDYLQPDVGRCGGITEFVKIATLAESHGLALTCHLLHELSVSLVPTCTTAYAVEWLGLVPDSIFATTFEVVDGRAALPNVPGHGIELAEDTIGRFRR